MAYSNKRTPSSGSGVASGGSYSNKSRGRGGAEGQRQRINKALGEARATGDDSLFDKVKGVASGASRGGMNLVSDALNLLDTPRAVVTSAINELSQVGNEEWAPGKSASFGDFLRQITNTDERVGMGDFVAEADLPINLKRAVGFLGDVAFDPLTYATFGASAAAKGGTLGVRGAGKVMRGRNVALRLADAGYDDLAEEVLQSSAGRLMKDAAGRAAAEEIGVNLGVRIGAFGRGVMVPGSDRLAGRASDLAKMVRLGGREIPGSEFLAKTLSPNAESVNLRRSGKALEAEKANQASRVARGRAEGFANDRLRKLADMGKRLKGVDGPTLRRAIEGDDVARAAQPEWKEIADFLEDTRQEVMRITGRDIPTIENYFPHQLTEEFRDFLKRGQPQNKKRVAIGKAGLKEREYRVGRQWLGRNLERGTIEEMEEIAREEFGDNFIKLFKDDPIEVAAQYIKSMQRMVERHKFLNETLERGLILKAGEGKEFVRRTKSIANTERKIVAGADRATRAAERARKAADQATEVKDDLLNETNLFDATKSVRRQAQEAEKATKRVTQLRKDLIAATRSGDKDRIRRLTDELDNRKLALKMWDEAARIEKLGGPEHKRLSLMARLEGIAANGQADSIMHGWKAVDDTILLKSLKDSEILKSVADMQAMGFREVTELLPGGWSDPDVARLLVEMETINTPEKVGALIRAFDEFQSRWKAWALFSGGYHVRNKLGGMFANSLAGVNLDMYPKFSGLLRRYIKTGTTGDVQWDAGLANMFEHGVVGDANIRDLSDVMSGAAHRRGIFGKSARGKRLDPTSLDFILLEKNARIAQFVERSLRGPLFMDVWLKTDGNLDEALDAVATYHFDYSELSAAERSVGKRLIPFYTWTRKNLPLQIEHMVRTPGKYTKYLHAKRNIEMGTTRDPEEPGYYEDTMSILTPFTRGGNPVHITPDLPFTGLNTVLNTEEVTSSVSPLVRLPMELMAGKQAFGGIPLNGEVYKPVPPAWEKIPGFMVTMDFLGGVGGLPKVSRHNDGTWMMTDREMYKVESMLPALGRSRRLVPNEPRYQQRQLLTWMSFLGGVGARTLDDSARFGELFGRAEKIDRIMKDYKQRNTARGEPSGAFSNQ